MHNFSLIEKKKANMCFGMLSLISFLCAVHLPQVFCVCDIRIFLILHKHEETFINTTYSSVGY